MKYISPHMKITLRILRILTKLSLLAYVMAINLIFIIAFYVLVLNVVQWIVPGLLSYLLNQYALARHLIDTLPLYLILLYTAYSLSPLKVWMIRTGEGYTPLCGSDQKRVARLLEEMGVTRKLSLHGNYDATPNAITVGFNTLGFTAGVLQTASDEELKGIISHELGHISHRDFVYDTLLYSMESLGRYCLYGLFFIPALIFGFIGGIIAGFLGMESLMKIIAEIWWGFYKLSYRIIYGISKIARVNINKYGEYRCDAYAIRYNCGTGLLSFLRKQKVVEIARDERPTFTEYIMSTHPATEKRIARLEKRLP